MNRFNWRTLPVQMIASFTGLVLLTAAAVGVPAIWLIWNQLDRQAWAQVAQAHRAAQALYAVQQSEISGLATLTAQRPTLTRLLNQQAQAPLQTYLRTLQEGAGLELVLICTANHQILAQAGQRQRDDFCNAPATTTRVITGPDGPQIWLLAGHSLPQQREVVVGITLNNSFATQMQTETGLEHTLWVDDQIVATSLPGPRQTTWLDASISTPHRIFNHNNRPYYALSFWPLPPAGGSQQPTLQAEVALPVADLVSARQNLVWIVAASIGGVALIGSLLGTFLARRISRPLARLTNAAIQLSQGNLERPIAIQSRVREVTLVAQALESARVDLQHMLDQLRGEKAWVDHLLEAIVEGIITLDPHNRIKFFSSGAERITGWQRDDVLNRHCDDVFQPLETSQPFSQFIPPPGRRYKINVALAQQRQATLSVTGAQLMPPESGDARIALVFRDVSEEEAVHRLMGHFLANVAHEFRTPLTAVAASVELLMDQAPDLTQTELQELLLSLHMGILGLQKLVDNLLESASIEAGRFRVNVRPTDLGKIIAEAIRMMQPLLNKHQQQLVLELPTAIPRVQADSRRTVQALVNLLSNASKYGPDEAEISITATLKQNQVRVAVGDRGPGVPREERHDLFRRLVYPGAGSDKSQYGAGLGLSVVKAVVEAQGGQVGVEDRPGGGLIFWFTLPLEQTP